MCEAVNIKWYRNYVESGLWICKYIVLSWQRVERTFFVSNNRRLVFALSVRWNSLLTNSEQTIDVNWMWRWWKSCVEWNALSLCLTKCKYCQRNRCLPLSFDAFLVLFFESFISEGVFRWNSEEQKKLCPKENDWPFMVYYECFIDNNNFDDICISCVSWPGKAAHFNEFEIHFRDSRVLSCCLGFRWWRGNLIATHIFLSISVLQHTEHDKSAQHKFSLDKITWKSAR